MLRIMSSAFMYIDGDDGYFNVPDQAIGYPLCQYLAVTGMYLSALVSWLSIRGGSYIAFNLGVIFEVGSTIKSTWLTSKY